MEAWSRWVDGDPPPPSWGLVFELCVAALLGLAILADLWLPALDQMTAFYGK